ncbi:MFS transporter [Anaerovibrio sp.]|uniref:MFS transporter n=1 Tax=Anaerovibrio sp. TaxID=1872532 RepID=UPI0025D2359C|nr:MFS transporter [Anaerovibrio sp.]
MDEIKCSPGMGVFLLSGGHFMIDFYNNFLPVLLPIIMVKMDMSLTMCGLLVMVLSITANLLQPIFGYFFDRHNYSRAMVYAVALSGVFICFVGYSPNKPVLFLLCALLGVAVSAYHPLGTSLLGKVSNKLNMGRSVSFYVAGGNIGFALAPVLVVAFLDRFSLETLPVLILPGVILAAAYIYTNLWNMPSKGRSTAGDAVETDFKGILKNRDVVWLNLSMGFRCWAHVSVVTFLPLLMQSKGLSAIMSGTLLAVFLAGSAIGGLFGGEIGDRTNHKKVMIYSLVLSIFPVVYFFLMPNAGIMAIIALFLAGALLMAPQPSSIVWTGHLMPDYIGVASGMMMGFCYGIGSIGAAVTAVLGDYIGLDASLLISIVPVFLAIILIIATPYRDR